MENEIDPLVKELIADLNAAGFKTLCSCQGKTSSQDYDDRTHCDRAFVTFSLAVIRKMAVKARKMGLGVSLQNRFITSLCGNEKGHAEVMAKNIGFPVKMRELFGL